ncbi:MAG: PilZ domain-containing protein [Bdellovibrionota bacterium]
MAAADTAVREAVSGEFQQHGSQVLAVAGGIEAYELARERHVDAVLAACRLTSGSPALLLSDVRRLNHDVPVILFGAAGENFSQTEALHRGFAAFFLTAFPTGQFAEAVVRSLEFVEDRKKKKVERVVVAAQAEIFFDSLELKAPVLNLSRGGMFLSLERSFPAMHSEVRFRLAFPPDVSQPPIEGKALVRWVRERPGAGHLPGVGIEFLEISDDARKFIEGYVERTSHRKPL